jgi:hypothetical protein
MGDVGERYPRIGPRAPQPPLDAPIAQPQLAAGVEPEQRRGDRQNLVAQRLGGDQQHAAAGGAPACATAAHAIRRRVGVADMNLHIIGIDAQRLGDDLRECRLIALA